MKWQFDGYSRFHQRKFTLVLHVLTVPLFWLGLAQIGWGAYEGEWRCVGYGAGALLIPLIVQGIAHKKEPEPPEPFLGPLDFVSRFFAEQLITFPRWLLARLSK
ncbi:MAG: terminase [Bdellovibrionia bacterium]